MSKPTNLKHLLFGRPIHSRDAHHERLNVPFGLAVFASDALSSVAYATEEILLVLILAGTYVAYEKAWPIAIALVCLMCIVGFSYYQTIHEYPEKGGTYNVSKENLGPVAGQVAGASLLIDYVLTVSVSISSGVQALVSIWPHLHGFEVPIALTAVGFLCLMNLRGAKESGIVFAIPTYLFVTLMLVLIGTSFFREFGTPKVIPALPPGDGIHTWGWFLMLRGFAASCTAMTGTEAISDGVKAFKKPEARNASLALTLMVVLLGIMFLGITRGALHAGIVPMDATQPGYQTVLAQFAQHEFGNGFMFQAILIAAGAILFLAANTAYADFPRLCSFIGGDGYLPRQLTSLGDRLVFQNGILLLTIVSGGLIVLFKADTHLLIPLYALGVFIGFTLSQTGMVVHFRKLIKRNANEARIGGAPLDRSQRRSKRQLIVKMCISGFGAVTTCIVALILAYTKMEEGAYLVVIAIGVLMVVFHLVRRHYNWLANELTITPADTLPHLNTATLLLVPRMHKGILQAVEYARMTSPDCRAIHVSMNPDNLDNLKSSWVKFAEDIPLIILDSPYRSIIEPVTEYVDSMLERDPDLMVTVIVPQAVPNNWFQGLLHNNAATLLKQTLGRRSNVVITNVRYHLSKDQK